MSEMKIKNGKAYCEECGKDVHVRTMKSEASTRWKPYILVDVDDAGHVIAERSTEAELWESVALLDRGPCIRFTLTPRRHSIW